MTPAELNDDNNLCIVCREEMATAKRLPCGHILHSHCLLNWLQRQQTCPICRMSVLAPPQYAPRPPQAPVQQPPQYQPQAEPQPQPAVRVEQPVPQRGMMRSSSPQQQYDTTDGGESAYTVDGSGGSSDVEPMGTPVADSTAQGEMLQTLQVPYHVAGCPSVIANLRRL